MALVKNGNTEGITPVEELANKKVKPGAFMSWEMVAADGSPMFKEDGETPLLSSDPRADFSLFGLKGYGKSIAEERLIEAAKNAYEAGEVLELTMKVKIKYYDTTPKPVESPESLFEAMKLSANK